MPTVIFVPKSASKARPFLRQQTHHISRIIQKLQSTRPDITVTKHVHGSITLKNLDDADVRSVHGVLESGACAHRARVPRRQISVAE